ncbi:MAG: crosslink repair DNA glycosylase YcaQ family protein [Pseudomonadota bacterium]
MRARVSLSQAEARRIACAAAGFDRGRPSAPADRRHFRRVMDTLHVLQLDFVNVLVPAHYLVLWSRLGGYDIERFRRFVYGAGDYTEHWAHEACIVPARYWPLLAYRRASYKPWASSPMRTLAEWKRFLQDVLARIHEEGALSVRDFEAQAARRRNPKDWHRSPARHALEQHFGHGRLSVPQRLPGFERVYDLPHRVLPAHHDLPPVDARQARRMLLVDAAAALGVATRRDLADYFRMSAKDATVALNDVLEEGEVSEVRVEGWAEPAYLSRKARLPRRIGGASLMSPFDPLTWCRPRLERLFDFHYRLEIYTPEARRRWGYYVLPFRLGDRLVGRLDLKADRAARTLSIRRAYAEEHANPSAVAEAMAAELTSLANWLGLERLRVDRGNSFSRMLHNAAAGQTKHGGSPCRKV